MEQIYNNALAEDGTIDGEPVNVVIPLILKRNYGYISGIRNSDDTADKKLTKYICQRFPGYATNFMATDFGGEFHREIVICDKNNVDYVKKLTEIKGEPVDEAQIKAQQKLRTLAKNDADNRAQKKQRSTVSSSAIPPPIFGKNLFADSDSDEEGGPTAVMPLSSGKNLFGDSDEEGGGKSRKRTKSHKKQMRNKRRKTHKKGKPKKATRKRK